MRTASLVLGIIGGVFGIIAALLELALGGIGAALEVSGAAGALPVAHSLPSW